MRLLTTLAAALAGAALLVSLGVWQVQRLAWKEGVIAALDARLYGEPMALPDAPDPASHAYLPVRMEGVIEDAELHVLASSKDLGPIFRIVSPFAADGGRRVLLDRGAVRAGQEDAPRAGGRAVVLGNLHWPLERDRWTPPDDLEANIWYARDAEAMGAALGAEPVMVIAREVALASGADPAVRPLPLDSASIPNDHLGYAITWFGLAIAWCAMAGALLWRQARRPEPAVHDAARDAA